MLSGASSGDMKGFLAMGDEYRGIRVGPWLERLGWKPRGKEAPMPRPLSWVFGSSWASVSSGVSSGRNKKLTSEGVEGPSVSADSDSSGVPDVSELPLRLRSCSFRFLRGSVPSGSPGWPRAASDTLRRIGSVRGTRSGASWAAGQPGCVVGMWVAGREGHRALEEELCPRALDTWSVPPRHLLGDRWELHVPKLQLQGAGGRSLVVLEVELCSSGGVCMCVCVVSGKVKSRSLYLWESLFPLAQRG